MPAVPFIFMGISAMGFLSAAKGAEAEGIAQQRANEYNAKINENEATAIETKTAAELDLKKQQYARLMGSQRASYAAAGVDLSTGSPLEVLTQQAYQAEKDMIATGYSGDVEATSKRNQATLNRFYGDTAVKTADTKATSTLIEGIGNMGATYYGGKIKGKIPVSTNA